MSYVDAVKLLIHPVNKIVLVGQWTDRRMDKASYRVVYPRDYRY